MVRWRNRAMLPTATGGGCMSDTRVAHDDWAAAPTLPTRHPGKNHTMSRLDSFIRRMQAQRACIDAAATQLNGLQGPVLELGLGNGRTYDHLRERFPDRPIFVFERQVAAHPDCIPPDHFLRQGELRDTIPAFAAEGQPGAALIHADVGSGDKGASGQLAADLAPHWARILAPGGFLASDQAVDQPGLDPWPMPEGVDPGRYHLYRRSA